MVQDPYNRQLRILKINSMRFGHGYYPITYLELIPTPPYIMDKLDPLKCLF
jgi:hypothetical protein